MPQGSAHIMFNNRFYLVAIIFLVFDVEVVLLFPVLSLLRRAATHGQGWSVFALAALFLLILLAGLIYEWKRGDIDWFREARLR
jgi:NADH-quinone oxidoreductase subunit A